MPMRALPWLLLSAVLPAQDPTLLRLAHSLTEDSRFAFSIAVENWLQFEDAKKDSRTTFELTFDATCAATTDGAARVRCVLRRLRAKIASPNANVAYDSQQEEPPTGPLRKLTDLVDAPFDLLVEPNGTIRSVDAPPPLDETVSEEIGTDFRSLFAAYFVRLPSEPIEVGASFDCATVLFGEPPGQGPTRSRVTLTSVDDGVARLDLAYDARKPPPRPGMRFEMRESSGTITFDVARGRLLSANSVLLARATRTSGGKDVSATSRVEVRSTSEEPGPRPADGSDGEPRDGRTKPAPGKPESGDKDGGRPREDGRPGR